MLLEEKGGMEIWGDLGRKEETEGNLALERDWHRDRDWEKER